MNVLTKMGKRKQSAVVVGGQFFPRKTRGFTSLYVVQDRMQFSDPSRR